MSAPTNKPGATREEYLNTAARAMWPWIIEHGAAEPSRWRVSCGFPKGSRGANKAIGQCWDAVCSGDSAYEMFITPTISGTLLVLSVLLHEMIHAGVGLKCGHKGAFRKVATAAGLTGKMTATVAGPELTIRLNELIERIGQYPHAAMKLVDRIKQGTRLIKCQCSECGYTCRTTTKWLDEVGAPLCPCNQTAMDY